MKGRCKAAVWGPALQVSTVPTLLSPLDVGRWSPRCQVSGAKWGCLYAQVLVIY